MAVATSTLAMIGATMAVAGVGMQIAGQYQASQAEIEAEKYNRAVYEQQARQIDEAKRLATERGERQKRLLAGKYAATTAAQGRLLGGSALYSMIGGMTALQLDQDIEQYNLSLEKSQALSAVTMGNMRIGAIRRSRNIGIATSLLSDTSKIFFNFAGATGGSTNVKGGTGTVSASERSWILS